MIRNLYHMLACEPIDLNNASFRSQPLRTDLVDRSVATVINTFETLLSQHSQTEADYFLFSPIKAITKSS